MGWPALHSQSLSRHYRTTCTRAQCLALLGARAAPSYQRPVPGTQPRRLTARELSPEPAGTQWHLLAKDNMARHMGLAARCIQQGRLTVEET